MPCRSIFKTCPLNGQPGEVWGLAWRSDPAKDLRFPGLAYCVGAARVLRWLVTALLDEEMPSAQWPANVVTDLKATYFDQAAKQIGTDSSNDFIDGSLHRALRKMLRDGITAQPVRHAIPLNELPLHLPNPGSTAPELLKLEAPLAVQGRPPLPGFFPINKFSSVPLLMEASRVAQVRSAAMT